MLKEDILKILEKVAKGAVSPADAFGDLRHLPFEDMNFAKLDSHRHMRNGFSEVIFCQGKTADQVILISERMIEKKINILGTRCDETTGGLLCRSFGDCVYDKLSATFQVLSRKIKPIKGSVAILAAGTADLRTAEEARKTVEFFGASAKSFYDVGVAGIHRLFANIKELDKFDALIAVAGMEGALPSVLGGLVGKPIVAVPTSVGYGSNLGGLTPLFAMLNSCSEGITVVNIDNGFGAACAALRILKGLA